MTCPGTPRIPAAPTDWRLERVSQPAIAMPSCSADHATTCWSIRPRIECSLKTGRKCRHSSCQSASAAGAEDIRVPTKQTVDVLDVLHRDQRTVCVTSPFVAHCHRTFECSDQFRDSVQNGNSYECKFAGSASRSCCFHVRFSMQRFCSAVLCGLLLLTALRPYASMAAPVPQDEKPNWRNPCGGSVSKDVHNSGDIPQSNFQEVLRRLKLQMGPIIGAHHKFRDSYCRDRFYGGNCTESFSFDDNNFHFPVIPKKLNEKLEANHFRDKDVDDLLRDAYRNLQTYALALTKLTEHTKQRRDTLAIYSDYDALKRNVLLLMCELQVLLKQRNLEPPADIDANELNIPQENNDDFSTTTLRDWAILREALNGVEYFDQLLDHVLNTQQTRL